MPNYTILLIDYDPRSIEKLRTPLVRAGLRVEVAKDGLTGIKRFHELKPDLTLIEAMIPKKHGFEVCQELKKTPHGQASAVLIITSVYKGRKYRTQAMHNYRCDEYLEKPISDESLVDIVKRHLPVRPTGTSGTGSDGGSSDDPVIELSDDELLNRLDAVLPESTVGTPKASLTGSEVEDTPHPQSDNVVHFDVVRSRTRVVSAEGGPTTGLRGAPRVAHRPFGGAVQHAVAHERMERPHSIEPHPAPEVRTAPRRRVEPDKRGRVYFWIALALAATVVALIATILAV